MTAVEGGTPDRGARVIRTLLTGGTGYLGPHILLGLLADGQEVTALVRSPERLGPLARHPRVRVWLADLEDDARVAEGLPGHDVCVHAALIWGPPRAEFELRDAAAAAKLFDAAGSAGVSRCVLISSAAVHRPFAGVMAEDDCLTTADVYGATKASGELFLRAACATHRMEGVVVRPGPIVGPPAFAGGSFRSDDRIAAMVAAAVEGLPVHVVRGDGRQFSDVAAVSRAVVRLTTAASPHPAYLCLDRHLITWEQVARMVIEATASRSDVVLLDRDSSAPVPRFRVERLERLLGAPSDAREALKAHIAHLARR